MRYLLDTHILFWSLSDEEKIPKDILTVINDPNNDIYFSTASVWEVIIKHAKNPGGMPVGGQEFVEGCLTAGFANLPICNHHVLAIGSLVRKAGEPRHNDPFDRILIAQAKIEEMKFITHDSLLGGYGEACVISI